MYEEKSFFSYKMCMFDQSKFQLKTYWCIFSVAYRVDAQNDLNTYDENKFEWIKASVHPINLLLVASHSYSFKTLISGD